MIYLLGFVLFLLGVCASVALHEAGHMLTAKAFGMKVRRYFVGFGPRIFSFRRGETEYGLKAIPLGGFCDIAGMTAMDEVTPDEDKRAMWRYPVWQRTVVLAAGSATHFLLGFIVLYLMAVTYGLPNIDSKPQLSALSCAKSTTTLDEYRTSKCEPGDPTPAKDAGLLPGDVITAVNGKPIQRYEQVQAIIKNLDGTARVQVDRDGERKTFDVPVLRVKRPDLDAYRAGNKNPGVVETGLIGVGFPNELNYGAGAAIGATVVFTGDMFVQTWHALMRFPERIPAVVEAIFGGERDPDTPVSIVGASRIGGEAAELGLWQLFIFMLAMLNLFVGVFNLLPLLPLDGGHIAVTWYEKVRDWVRRARGKAAGGPVDYTKLSMVTMVIVILGGAVVLLTVTADIVNPIRLSP